MLISNNLRVVLRKDGYSKLASEVMRANNEYVGQIDNISGAIRSIAIKVATNRENEKIINDGLASYRRVQEL